jgi:hypothetical protein
MRNLFWLLFIAAVMQSCSNEPPKGEFTKEELSWLVYNKADKVLFKDSAGKKQENLAVTFRTELNQIKQYYPIEAEVALSDIDSVKSFRIYLLKDQNGFKKYLRFGEVYRSLDIVKPVAKMTIGTTTYNEVYVIAEDTVRQKQPIWKVWYNKESGILQYTNINNETFSLAKP